MARGKFTGRKGLLLLLSCFIILCLNNAVSSVVRKPLYVWDEALYANNSLEMARNHNFWTYTVGDTIDHQNTKPPLVLWMQAAAGKMLGYSELSVRFPSLLALLAVAGLLVFYLRRYTGSLVPGFLTVGLLLTCRGAIRAHVFLTGDLDAVLTVFTTWITLHIILCIKSGAFTTRDMALLGALFCGGFLTKSTAVFLIIPSLLVCMPVAPRVIKSISWGNVLATAAAVLLFITGYYFLRERYDPGYWGIVWHSEFRRVSEDVQPWLHFPRDIYFDNFYHRHFKAYLLLFTAIAPLFLLLKSTRHKRIVIQLTLSVFVYLLFISLPPVKLEYYDAPVYPWCAAALALVIYEACLSLLSRHTWYGTTGTVLIAALVAYLCVNSFSLLKRSSDDDARQDQPQQVLSDALRYFHNSHMQYRHFTILSRLPGVRFAHHLDAVMFYKKAYALNEHKEVRLAGALSLIQSGDTVLCANKELQDSLAAKFNIRVLDATPDAAITAVAAMK